MPIAEFDIEELEAPREWDLDKHPKQSPFIWNRSRFAIWQGGRGSTKTTSAMWRILTTCYEMVEEDEEVSWEVRPEWVGAEILIAAPIMKQVQRGPRKKFDEVFDQTGLILEKNDGNDPKRKLVGNITIYFFNVGKNGDGAESWRGAEYAICLLDEAAQMPEKTCMLGNATCRQKRPNGSSFQYQTIITTTPQSNNWLNRRFLDRESRLSYKTRKGEPMYPDERVFITHSTTWESIEAGILEEDYVDNLGYTPGTLMYEQEIMGKVVTWFGRVFDDGWKIIGPDHPRPPQFIATYGGIDPGTIDPTAIVIVGIDTEGAMWVIREYYEARARMDKWIGLVGEWTHEFGVRKWFVDNDITCRLMKAAGFQAKFPYKQKDAADDAVRYINQLIGRGMLYIDPSCRALLSEMVGYKYKETWEGEEVTFLQKVQPNQPDHAIDALRYAVLPLSAVKAAQAYGKEVSFAYG